MNILVGLLCMIDLTAIKFHDPGDGTHRRWTVYQLEREQKTGVLYWGIVRDYLEITSKKDKELILKDYPNAIELNQCLVEEHTLGQWSDNRFRRKFTIKFEDSHLERGEA